MEALRFVLTSSDIASSLWIGQEGFENQWRGGSFAVHLTEPIRSRTQLGGRGGWSTGLRAFGHLRGSIAPRIERKWANKTATQTAL